MPTPQPIALLGFSEFERNTLDSFLRLAVRRTHGFDIVPDVAQAALVIANGDAAELLRSLRQRRDCPPVLLIGYPDELTSWPVQPRPMKLMSILLEVDRLLQSRGAAAKPPEFAKTQPFVPVRASASREDDDTGGFAATRPFMPNQDMGARPRSSVPATAFAVTQPFAPLEMPGPAASFAATQPFAPLEMPGTGTTEPQDAQDSTGFAATQAFDAMDLAPARPVRAMAPSRPRPAEIDAADILQWRQQQARERGETPVANATPAAPVAVAPRRSAAAAPPPAYSHSTGLIGLDQMEAPAPAAADSQEDVLLVDESDAALGDLQWRLKRYGFRADLARSGAQALQRLAARRYWLVLVDVSMKGMDGYQVCRAIRLMRFSGAEKPSVVLLSNRGGTIEKIRAKLAGSQAFLTKPVDDDALKRLLARYDDQAKGGLFAWSRHGLRSRHSV